MRESLDRLPPPTPRASSDLGPADDVGDVLRRAAGRLHFDSHSSDLPPDVEAYLRSALEYAAVLRAAPNESLARQGLEHACYALGNRLADRQDWTNALAAYDLALAIAPPPPTASWRHLTFIRRCAALVELERFTELLAACDAVLAGQWSELAVHHARFDRAVALHGLGRFADALAAFDEVLAWAPGHREARHNRQVLAAQITPR